MFAVNSVGINMVNLRIWATSLMLTLLLTLAAAQEKDSQEFGHSSHGVAFDTGLRTKPWKMSGLGSAHFAITTKVPEVQEWFDQGNALLHSFWYEEAERTFRWCIKLDPDCAMAYWGLAVTGFNWSNMAGQGGRSAERYRTFLKEAMARRDKATPRERMFIEAWDAAFGETRSGQIATKLADIVKAFPDDIEAKAYAALFSIGRVNAAENDKMLQEVLKVNPDHPGAHHYRIHNWDFPDPNKGLDSCARYGQVATSVGHAMHMPGHIYSKVGMWHEAARAMDSATRVELKYMNARMALPFEAWNFSHNRNYLSYIQEQLGMADAAIRGARDLIAAPMDPKYDNFETYNEGVTALTRALVKFERWEEIVRPGSIPWRRDRDTDRSRAEAEGMALVALGRLDEAKRCLSILVRKKPDEHLSESEYAGLTGAAKSLAGQILIASGQQDAGMALLKELADTEKGRYGPNNHALGDPPDDPQSNVRIYADRLLRTGRGSESIPYYEASLGHLPNDGFALAGLALAQAQSGNTERARYYAGRLLAIWSNADKELSWIRQVNALKLNAKPVVETPFAERKYVPRELDRIGPSNWEPYPAPNLTARDPSGKTVRLSDYRGKNVLLIFYLSDECVHCMEQLFSINEKAKGFADANTVVLAVSSATPQHNRDSLKLGKLGFRLLSDRDHQEARRFASYDDFEEMELHSTILIDAEGKVRWKRTGGDPFTDVDWLLKEIGRFGR